MPSTIHRFTPPTCTLEIIGNRSSLSRWANKNISQKIRFQLRFDDPRKPTAKQITISGDQQDLLLLHNAVNSYTQQNLNASFQSPLAIESNRKTSSENNHNYPYLTSQGLVHHQLFLKSLSHDGNSDRICLSTVQLFDLVTALTAYEAEMAVIVENKEQAAKSKITLLWGGIAAAAIAATGITSILLKSPEPQNIASSPESQSAPEMPELDEIVPPAAPETASQPAPQPTKTLESAAKLPPPPAVDTPKPKPNIPDPADYPLADVARQSGLRKSDRNRPSKQAAESIIEAVPAKPQEREIEPQKSAQSTEVKPLDTAQPKIESESTAPSKDQNQINTVIDSKLNVANDSSPKPTEDKIALRNAPPPSQIQQVITYFEKQWQPPDNLKQSLEYRLLLNPDGSIKKVVPLGKAAQIYLSQTNIPVNGESFMSPPSESQSSKIRVLLNPDGQVQAFAE